MRWTTRKRTRATGAVLGFLLAGAALFTSSEAAADITVAAPLITRVTSGTDLRLQDLATVSYISKDDCDGKRVFAYPVQIGSASPSDVHVWVSAQTDCSTAANRTMVGTTCVPLGNAFDMNGQVPILASDIVTAVLGSDGCNAASSLAGSTDPVGLTLYFMILPGDSGDAATNDVATFAGTEIDLWGPPAITGMTVAGGDGELIVNLPANPDLNTQGYYIFCYPWTGATAGSSSSSSSSSTSNSSSSSSSSSSGTGGAGTGGAGTGGAGTGGAGTGGAGGMGTASTPCPGGVVVPPADLTLTSPYLCGSRVSSTETLVNVTSVGAMSLQNDFTYFVAVAAYDEVDNLGPVSSPFVCGQTQPVDSFYKAYCTDGGSDCGGCGIGDVGGRGPLWPALGAAVLAAVAVIVRRERARGVR
jgi:hypothetical protein